MNASSESGLWAMRTVVTAPAGGAVVAAAGVMPQRYQSAGSEVRAWEGSGSARRPTSQARVSSWHPRQPRTCRKEGLLRRRRRWDVVPVLPLPPLLLAVAPHPAREAAVLGALVVDDPVGVVRPDGVDVGDPEGARHAAAALGDDGPFEAHAVGVDDAAPAGALEGVGVALLVPDQDAVRTGAGGDAALDVHHCRGRRRRQQEAERQCREQQRRAEESVLELHTGSFRGVLGLGRARCTPLPLIKARSLPDSSEKRGEGWKP